MNNDRAPVVGVQCDNFEWVASSIRANMEYSSGGVFDDCASEEAPADCVFHVGIGYSMLSGAGVDDQYQTPINVVRKEIHGKSCPRKCRHSVVMDQEFA